MEAAILDTIKALEDDILPELLLWSWRGHNLSGIYLHENYVRFPAELPSVLPLPVPPNLVEIVCPAGVFPVEAVLEGYFLVDVAFHGLQPPLGYLFAAVRSASPLVQRIASPHIKTNRKDYFWSDGGISPRFFRHSARRSSKR